MEKIFILFDQIIREPSLFLGVIVLIGTLFLKKTTTEVIASTFKTIIGVRLVQVGANLLVAASKPMMEMVLVKFNIQARIADPWTGVGESFSLLAGNPLVGKISLIMGTAWLLHLFFSRVTRLKTVHLAAQIMFSDTVLVCYFVFVLTGVFNLITASIMVILLAFYWWFWPALMSIPLKKLIPNDNLTIGHNTVFGGFLAIFISRVFGQTRNSTEDLNFPDWLKIMEDPVASHSLIMVTLFMLIALLTKSDIVYQITGDVDPFIFAFNRGIEMAAGLTALLYGAKIFQKELIPAFEEFARRIVPGAIPAVDAVLIWEYAPKATILGVIFTIMGMFLGILIQIIFKSSYITIPGAIPMFIGGSTIGVLASKFGGVRGTIISTITLGIIQILGSTWLSRIVDFKIAGGGQIDYCTYWPIVLSVFKLVFRFFQNI